MKKYTKEQILIAAEIGEVSMIDARHIVSLLDEAVILELERKLRKHNVSGSLPLAELEKRLDEVLDKETSETLNKWLEEKRK